MADSTVISPRDAGDQGKTSIPAGTAPDHEHLVTSAIGTPSDITKSGGFMKTNASECGGTEITDCYYDAVIGQMSYSGETMMGSHNLPPDASVAGKSPDQSWDNALKKLGPIPETDKLIAAYPELRDITKVKNDEWGRIYGQHDLREAEGAVLTAAHGSVETLEGKHLLPNLNDHSYRGSSAILQDKLLGAINDYSSNTTRLGDPKTEADVKHRLDESFATIQKELEIRQKGTANPIDAHAVVAPIDKAYSENERAFKDAPNYAVREEAARKSYATMAGQMADIARTALVYKVGSMSDDERAFMTRVAEHYSAEKREADGR